MGASADAIRAELLRRELARREAAAPKTPTFWERFLRLQNDPMALVTEGMTPEQLAEVGLSTNRNLAAGASRLVTAPGQLVTAGAEAAGVPGASTADYNAAVQGLEQDIAGGAVDPAVAGVGEVGSGVMVPIGAASRAKTLLGAVGQGAKTGALTGAVLGQDPNANTPGEVATSAAGRAATGAALGGGLAAVGGVVPSLWNTVVRMTDKGRPVKETAALLAEKAKSALFRDVPLTAAQESGSPVLASLQAQVAGKRAFDFQNAQLEKFGKAADDISAAMTGSKSPQVAAEKLAPAIGRTTAGMQSAASKEYEQGLDAVRTLAAKDPRPFRVGFDNFEEALKGAQAGIGGPKPRSTWYSWISPETIKADPKLQEAIDVLSQARAAGQTGLTVDTIINVKKAANYLRRGLNAGPNMSAAQAEQNRLGKTIAKGIEKDIDSFMAQTNQQLATVGGAASDPTRDALKLLDEVNSRYKGRIDQINSQKASFVSQALGKVPKSPEEAFEALIRKDPDQQLRALNIMRNAAPEAIDDIKAWKMSQVSSRMRDQLAAGNVSAVDPAAFVKELTNGSDIVATRFWTPKELQDIKSGVATARLLLTDMPAGKTVSFRGAEDPGRIAGAAVTRSAPFVTLRLYNILGKGRLENILFSPEGVKALGILRDTYAKPTEKTIQALTLLTNLSEAPSPAEE